MTWLITGGAGYIGSHVVLRLLESGYDVIVFDDLSTGRIERIPLGVKFIQGDILDSKFLKSVILDNEVRGVIHLAGKKSVIESFEIPEKYFETNMEGTKSLLRACEESTVRFLIFSSTAAVYKDPKSDLALNELSPILPSSPYGQSKLSAENIILEDHPNQIRKIIFRYFNVTGAHSSEFNELNAPNLVPVIQRAISEKTPVEIFGGDHDTRDGTCVRDYIHVLDIADAHLAGIKLLEDPLGIEIQVINLGTGVGYSVLEVIDSFEDLYKVKINKIFVKKRPGDSSSIICNPTLAKSLLGWKVTRNPFSGVRNIIK